MATGVETWATVSSYPVQVPDAPAGVEGMVVQLWVRSPEGSWSGCLSSGEATRLAAQLIEAARRAGEQNERARVRRLRIVTERGRRR